MTWASGKVTPLSVLNFAITNSWRSPVSGFAGTSWARRAGQSRNRRSNFFMRDPQLGTEMSTTISRLSSLLLALSVSPIVDPVRDRLDGTVRHFSDLVGWATITVAVGVIL